MGNSTLKDSPIQQHLMRYFHALLELTENYEYGNEPPRDTSLKDEINSLVWITRVRAYLKLVRTLETDQMFLALGLPQGSDVGYDWLVRLNTGHALIGMMSWMKRLQSMYIDLGDLIQVAEDLQAQSTEAYELITQNDALKQALLPPGWQGEVPNSADTFKDLLHCLHNVCADLNADFDGLLSKCQDILVKMYKGKAPRQACKAFGLELRSESILSVFSAQIEDAIERFDAVYEDLGSDLYSEYLKSCLSTDASEAHLKKGDNLVLETKYLGLMCSNMLLQKKSFAMNLEYMKQQPTVES